MHESIKLLSHAPPKPEHFFNSLRVLWMVARVEAQRVFYLRRNRNEFADGFDGIGVAANQSEEQSPAGTASFGGVNT